MLCELMNFVTALIIALFQADFQSFVIYCGVKSS